MRGNGLLAVRMAGSLRPRLSPLAGSAAQNIIAGNGVGISHELISLEITSPEVPDLTLIDLPGIARVAVGNQPQDIGVQVRLSGTGVQTQLRGRGGSHGPSTLETGPPLRAPPDLAGRADRDVDSASGGAWGSSRPG